MNEEEKEEVASEATSFSSSFSSKFLFNEVNFSSNSSQTTYNNNINIKLVTLLGNNTVTTTKTQLPKSNTSIHGLCQKGSFEEVEQALSSKEVNINEQDQKGWTALHVACYWGREEIVKLLLNEKDINVNLCNNEGQTALCMICSFGKNEVVSLLLKDKRVKVNIASKEGKTPLSEACCWGRDKIVEMMLQMEDDKCLNVNQTNLLGWTPLIQACYFGNDIIVKLLLNDLRVDVNLKSSDFGWSPLLVATYWGRLDIVEILIQTKRVQLITQTEKDYYSSSGVTIFKGSTPLDVARFKEYDSIFDLILTESFKRKEKNELLRQKKENLSQMSPKDLCNLLLVSSTQNELCEVIHITNQLKRVTRHASRSLRSK